MKKMLITICLLVCVFGICGNVSANLSIPEIPSSEEPSGGGGGYGVIGTPPTSLNQSFDIGGLHMSAYATNYTNECNAGISFWAEQGVNNRYYMYENSDTSFYTYNWNPRQFRWNFNANFKVVDFEHYAPLDLDLSQHTNIDFFGVEFSSWSNIRNRAEWFWEKDEYGNYNEWSILTDNPELNAGFHLAPAQIYSMNPSIFTWSWEDELGYLERILNLSFSVEGYFLDSQFATAEEIGAMFVPEPATISLLCLGACGLLIRRKR